MIQLFRQKTFYSKKHKHPHQLAYTDWGDENNKNILVCVHGLTRNSRDFDYVARELSSKYRVICLDVIGRGKSQWVNPELYNYKTYLLDSIALLEHLKVNKVNWLGTSMGGIIGMMLTAKMPNIIRKLCLNDIGPYIPKSALIRITKYIGKNPKFDNLEHAETELKILLAQFGIKAPENWKHITLTSIMADKEGNLRLAYDPQISEVFRGKSDEDITDVDLTSLWENVVFKECLVLRGKLSDVLLPETLQFMLTSKRNINAVEFANVGHVPALMEPDQLKIVVDWFLSN